MAWPPLLSTGIDLKVEYFFDDYHPNNIVFDIYSFGSIIIKGAIKSNFTPNVIVVDNKSYTVIQCDVMDNGKYIANISSVIEPLVITFQDGGEKFKPNHYYSKGDIIRPSIFSGWVYVIVEDGVSDKTEPFWWLGVIGDDISEVGSALAKAVVYHNPIVHGPISKGDK